MNFRVVSHTIGLILLVEMAFMLPSLAWCWVDGEGGVALAFAVSLALMGLAAAAVLLAMGAAFFALSWLLLRRAMIRPAK